MENVENSGINQLIGQTIHEIKGLEAGSDEVIFTTEKAEFFKMRHYQNCCEEVSIEDIIGDINDILHTPILEAYEATNSEYHPEDKDMSEKSDSSFTWTFYRIVTIKGVMTIRWFGTSNGYYSESVDFEKVTL